MDTLKVIIKRIRFCHKVSHGRTYHRYSNDSKKRYDYYQLSRNFCFFWNFQQKTPPFLITEEISSFLLIICVVVSVQPLFVGTDLWEYEIICMRIRKSYVFRNLIGSVTVRPGGDLGYRIITDGKIGYSLRIVAYDAYG